VRDRRNQDARERKCRERDLEQREPPGDGDRIDGEDRRQRQSERCRC
jgi:hypothetical protein